MRNSYKEKMILTVALAVLVLTWSRASWISVGVAAGWWGISEEKNRLGRLAKLGVLVGLGILVWWAAAKPGGEGVNLMRTASIEQRLASWSEAVGVWKQHPWLGVGFNNYGVGSREYGVGKENHAINSPSSSWLLLLSTVGIAGLAGLAIGGIRGIGEIEDKQFWLGIILMISIHAIFNNTLFYPPVLGLAAIMRVMDSR